MDQQHWDEVAAGRRKWDEWADRTLAHMSESLMKEAGIRSGDCVLDIGTGTGHPAIFCAERLQDSGKVFGIDLSLEMLRSAKQKASGLRNVSFAQSDATSIPFRDSTFHSVISRCCIMFIPDVEKCLRATARVLKPGGTWSALVWADPQKNPLPLRVLTKHLKIDPPSPDKPGHYRFWQPGVLTPLLKIAGFSPVSEKEIAFEESYDSGQEFVHRFLESSVMAGHVKRESAPVQKKILEELVAAAEEYRAGASVRIPRFARIITARKL